MSNNFKSMMKNSKKNFSKLTETLEKDQKKKSYNDDRFWKLTRDENDNGFAIIRFLPPSNGENVPLIKSFNHGFFNFVGGSKRWYIEDSLTTIDQKDPVYELNGKLYQSGTEEDKAQASKQKRRMTYISNIYVVKDKANPDNEGKVFLFKYGKSLFDKVNDAMYPDDEDDDVIAFNPYDFMEGANFKLKARKDEGWVKYDKSAFAPQSEFLEGDGAQMEVVWNKQHSLQGLLAPEEFKTYEELSSKLKWVLGEEDTGSAEADQKADVEKDETEKFKTETPAVTTKTETVAETSFDEDEDDDDFFNKMANG